MRLNTEHAELGLPQLIWCRAKLGQPSHSENHTGDFD
jgi:hypothetical protein